MPAPVRFGNRENFLKHCEHNPLNYKPCVLERQTHLNVDAHIRNPFTFVPQIRNSFRYVLSRTCMSLTSFVVVTGWWQGRRGRWQSQVGGRGASPIPSPTPCLSIEHPQLVVDAFTTSTRRLLLLLGRQVAQHAVDRRHLQQARNIHITHEYYEFTRTEHTRDCTYTIHTLVEVDRFVLV